MKYFFKGLINIFLWVAGTLLLAPFSAIEFIGGKDMDKTWYGRLLEKIEK